MIKIDLHIHSIASKYKEDKSIVDDSTTKNIDTLLSKLDGRKVALFSITDHNRFNVELYKEIDRILNNPDCKYPIRMGSCPVNLFVAFEKEPHIIK